MTLLNGHGLGALPSIPDFRDWRLAPVMTAKPAGAMPARPAFIPTSRTHNQGAIGSCTGQSAATLVESVGENLTPGIPETLNISRFAAYRYGREALGTVNSDSGAIFRDILKAMAVRGVPVESLHPHDPTNLYAPLSPDAVKNALLHKITEYRACATVEEMKYALHQLGVPFSLAFSVYTNFDAAGSSGYFPRPGGSLAGAHQVVAVWYDDDKVCPGYGPGAFLVQNSWGASWGTTHPLNPARGKGFFWLPYEAAADRNLVWDVWAISKVPML